MTSDKLTKKPFLETTVAGAITGATIAGVFSLIAILLGYWLGTFSPVRESYDVSVQANEYPFADTNIRINEGDEVEIMVLAANRTSWECGLGATNSMGLVEHENQPTTVLPSENICALIGYIEGGPFFAIGAYDRFIADVSGSLFLGANDAPSEKCDPDDCYADNEGQQFVKITVTRNE